MLYLCKLSTQGTYEVSREHSECLEAASAQQNEREKEEAAEDGLLE